jgi:hypothetical protein
MMIEVNQAPRHTEEREDELEEAEEEATAIKPFVDLHKLPRPTTRMTWLLQVSPPIAGS